MVADIVDRNAVGFSDRLLNLQIPLLAQNPFNLRQYNYGNADYDTRHYASLNYVWNTPNLKSGWLSALASWTVSGTMFARTGYPYTVVDSSFNSTLGVENFAFPFGNAQVWANQTIPGSFSCGRSAAFGPCSIMVNGYASPTSTWGAQRRNQIYGPSFINTDLTVMKGFKIPHWEGSKLSLGAQFFNILNHPNFDQPVGDLASSLFGTIQRTISTPTSVYGSFLGADASPRQIQLRATLSF